MVTLHLQLLAPKAPAEAAVYGHCNVVASIVRLSTLSQCPTRHNHVTSAFPFASS